jgi:excisionase family DNA binding protein
MSHRVTTYDRPPTSLLSVNEVAILLGISRPSVYRMIRRGDLRPFRVGERLRFSPDEIDELLERSREVV